ncbi:hypothetical protein [Nocardioides acrostichi]|uniref:Uncharacterized protein n=1 Tax=Nocardioides acrostichi TaxID=2784339 RepID=A0A930YBW8_9ACTN|nr:hypothetical protein [Nocardioides acrostichi]MBF4162908.1 hypothetical protein [Nocardioides acrostichi]
MGDPHRGLDEEPLDLGELPQSGRSAEPATPPRRRRPPAWSLLVLVGLLLAALTAGLVDQRARSTEQVALDRCGTDARAAMLRADAVMGAMQEYLRPAYAFETSERSRAGLDAILAQEAVKVEPRLTGALGLCEHVAVWSVHRQLARERDAYVAYLRARLDQIRATAQGRPPTGSDERLARLRQEAFGVDG